MEELDSSGDAYKEIQITENLPEESTGQLQKKQC